MIQMETYKLILLIIAMIMFGWWIGNLDMYLPEDEDDDDEIEDDYIY